MRWKLLLLSLLFLLVPNDAMAKKHCYARDNVQVLTKDGRTVATIKRGTTFNYQKKIGNKVKINYYGRYRYVDTGDLVLDKKIEGFVNRNPELFGMRIRALEKGKVFTSVSIRSKALQKYQAGEEFNVEGEFKRWYRVSADGEVGYVLKSTMKAFRWVDVTSYYRPIGDTKRQRIINFAKRFLGNPYVWGGTSLTSGCDCSGYVQGIMKEFGIYLPRCSYQQAEVGKTRSPNKAKPGDLLFFVRGSRVGHVAMYLGDGKMIEAKGARWGIVISDVNWSTVHKIKCVI